MPLDIREIAIAAKDYARQYIKKGSSQLENNASPEEMQYALNIAVNDIRNQIDSSYTSNKEIFYEKKIEILKKYSLGNCGEMTQIALYYVVTHYPSLYAEYHTIHNGDHVVLIIGKKKPSRPHLEAWDEEDYICDPWSNQIYRVSEWKQHLKNYAYYFINKRPVNAVVSLKATQSLIPYPNFNSISFYHHGLTYRRDKIKEVLYLFRPFKKNFYTECLNALLCKRYLLRDYNINESLETSEETLRENLVKQSVDLLNRFAKYLQSFQNDPEFLKKCPLPVSDQLQKIYSAIACLDNLLKEPVITGSRFCIMAKDILKQYPCPSSKKIAVAEAMAKAEDINSFTSYFYEILKPTLEIRRNPNLDKLRGFFTSKSITVKGAQVAQQLEELIRRYSTNQLRPS